MLAVVFLVALAVVLLGVVPGAGGRHHPSLTMTGVTPGTTGAGPTGAAATGAVPTGAHIALAGRTSTVFVLATVACGASTCTGLYTGTIGSPLHAVTPPPGGMEDRIAFASAEDGYAAQPAGATGATLWMTTDGARTWNALARATDLVAVATGAGRVYAVATAGSGTGHEDRLLSAPLGSPDLAGVAIPGTAGLGDQPIGLAASGDRVWLDFTPERAGGRPVLVTSLDGRAPLSETVQARLASVAACTLDDEPGQTLWAVCPTGMLESFFRRAVPSGSFRQVWGGVAGTGGAAFDPVTSSLAFRYTGGRQDGGQVLQRTIDGGRRWETRYGALFPGGASELVFDGPADGIAAGSTADGGFRLVDTADGGRTWTPVRLGDG